MKAAILVLTRPGLELARRLVASGLDAETFGPSCVVGRCAPGGGPNVPRLAPTDEPGVTSWSGPLRKALPEILRDRGPIVAVMEAEAARRLIGPSPAGVVAVGLGGTCVVTAPGPDREAEGISRRVAELLQNPASLDAAPQEEARGIPQGPPSGTASRPGGRRRRALPGTANPSGDPSGRDDVEVHPEEVGRDVG